MTNDPLDFLGKEESSDPLDFLEETPSNLRSKSSAFAKGLIKGASNFSPLPSTGPVPQKLGKRITEQMLPSKKGNVEDILEFTGENLPLATFGEGGLLKKGLQALSGGLAKKGAKEVDLPEWAQDIIGTAGMSIPELTKKGLAKGLHVTPKQDELVNFLKSKGMSEKQITPIIQDPKKLSYLSKAAFKFSKKSPFVQGIKSHSGQILEDIRSRGDNANYLSGKKLDNFLNEFDKIRNSLPKRHTRLMKSEVEDLMNNPINFSSLRDFDIAVNDVIKDATGGKASLGKLKEVLNKGMREIDAPLFKELELGKKAYAKISDFADKMTTKDWKWVVGLGPLGASVMKSLMYGGIKLPIATAASQYAARKFLTSPRLQNIHRKLWNAVLKNNLPQTLKLMSLIEKEGEEDQS